MSTLLFPPRTLLPPSLPLLSRSKTTKSQALWLVRQQNDHHVTTRGSFRARSAFKLMELNKHYKLLRPSVRLVVDLGASPGGWSQVVMQQPKKSVVAVDLLPMEPIPGVQFVQGDFMEEVTQAKIRHKFRSVGDGLRTRADLVLSDMAGNVTGHGAKDAEQAFGIVKSCLEFAKVGLRVGHYHAKDGVWRPGGTLVMKHFTYPEISEFRITHLQKCFEEVYFDKPEASRAESAEAYFVCKGFRGDVLQKALPPPESNNRWIEDEEE